MNINDEIMQLIIRHLSNKSSGADDLALEAWLSERPENQLEFEKIKKVWETSASTIATPIDVNAEWEKFRSKHFAKEVVEPKVIRMPFGKWANYAAAAVILIGLFVGVRHFNSSENYSTGAGERLMVSLEDGSEIILSENSTLEVSRGFNKNKRAVKLDGEGFFTVAKNPAKPFEIEGAQTTTKVLGTAFQLIASENKNLINVSEGRVAYWSATESDTLILTKGERGSYTNRNLVEELINDKNFDSWKTGRFSFENQHITYVLEALQDYYVFNISNLSDYKNSNCRFSGKFENQELEDVLEELALTMGMDYSFEKSVMHINKFYCE